MNTFVIHSAGIDALGSDRIAWVDMQRWRRVPVKLTVELRGHKVMRARRLGVLDDTLGRPGELVFVEVTLALHLSACNFPGQRAALLGLVLLFVRAGKLDGIALDGAIQLHSVH